MPIQLPQTVTAALQQLQRQQIPVWVTGAAVRDCLLGRTPAGWELAAACTPQQLAAALPAAPPGVRVTACAPADDLPPQAALRAHLARQDFTVNAMAWDGATVIDPCHGRYDLADGLLRCVGAAQVRFAAEPLQVLRLYRLAAQLEFAVEPGTAAAALGAAAALRTAAPQQVRTELTLALTGARPSALWPLVACGGLQPFGIRYGGEAAEGHNPLLPLDGLPAVPVLRWWALAALGGCGLYRLQKALVLSERAVQALNRLQAFYAAGMPADRRELRQRLMHPLPGGDEAAILTFAAVDSAFEELPGLYAAVAARREPYRVEHLCITPAELLTEGVPAKKIPAVQRCLLQAAVDAPELNVWPVMAQMAKGLHRLV